MTAPNIQDPRQLMELYCEFDMGGEELYAVKWYKDDHEFFRYTPLSTPSVLQFPVEGVHVDTRRTVCKRNGCHLYLDQLSRLYSSGSYRCEVSSEAPAFRLASQTHNVTVAVIPEKKPVIEGISDRYLIGDLLTGTCTSGLGDPKPTLTWLVNKQEVPSKSAKELPQRPGSFQRIDERVTLKSTTLQLRLPLDRKLVQNKPSVKLEITCISTSDGVNAGIAAPLVTKKIVLVATEEQLVNNQKLYGALGSGCTKGQKVVVLFLCVVLLWYC